jgi:hypothetical protein
MERDNEGQTYLTKQETATIAEITLDNKPTVLTDETQGNLTYDDTKNTSKHTKLPQTTRPKHLHPRILKKILMTVKRNRRDIYKE